MAWSYIGAGTRATGAGSIQTILNGSTTTGDLIVLCAREKNPSNTLATPGSGYTTLWSTDVYQRIYAKYAGASEPNPSLIASNAYLQCFTIRWNGGTAPAIGSIVHTSNFGNAVQVNIPYGAVTISNANCFVFGFGYDSNGAGATASIADSADFPNNIDTITNINTGCGAIIDYVIQTTAASISASTWVVTNGTSNTVHGLIMALLPGTGGGGGGGENGAQMMMGSGS